MEDISLKVTNYKCFSKAVGFESIKRVNVIIGRNNSGKSSILDIIDMMISNSYESAPQTKLIIGKRIDEVEIRKTFFDNQRTSMLPGIYRNDFEYGMKLLGRELIWSEANSGNNRSRTLLHVDDSDLHPHLKDVASHRDLLLNNIGRPFDGKIFKRLSAERDIKPEPSSDGYSIAGNGQGLTNTIQNFINRSDLPSDLVEQKLLDGLNSIFSHDAHFVDIVCQLHYGSKEWEIYLEEKNKGRVRLSKSGSGLKTVISVLSFLIFIPHLEHRPLKDFIFGFEELENNIHPSLLRRLNAYIYQSSIDNDFIYFVTTHSNVLIDQFSKQDDAQIIHVSQKDGNSICSVATTYFDNHGILDDLDVRASDLLQANGIIWVEGPSDRIYINRWIDLFSHGELREGTHYQVVFYGGRLLSHLSTNVATDRDNGISILRANRNAAILIDSDKKSKSGRVNDTKKRIVSEFESIKSFCWLTKGREIENYIPVDAIKRAFRISSNIESVGQYESFFDYLEIHLPGKGKSYEGKKTTLASELIPYMTKDMLNECLDLNDNIAKLCDEIKKWNR
ncbi:ATP-dependent nuclease [Aeromonas hydrophila]|uniref:ATP-dependent nuclease n=1 Tax=Aeromonas hydrophila TaxID=644 RepID=UPI003EC94670